MEGHESVAWKVQGTGRVVAQGLLLGAVEVKMSEAVLEALSRARAV